MLLLIVSDVWHVQKLMGDMQYIHLVHLQYYYMCYSMTALIIYRKRNAPLLGNGPPWSVV